MPFSRHRAHSRGNHLHTTHKQNMFATAICPSDAAIHVRRFPATSRILHWIAAALVLVTWPLGLLIKFTADEVRLDFYLIHENLGFLLLLFMLLRVGNKLLAKSPPAEGPAIERLAASAVHGLLYLVLLVVPVSGFLATNAHGFPLHWFGVVPIWSPIGKAPEIAWTLSTVHSWSSWLLLALFAMHLGAVLLHHVIKRDNTLYRIL